jgi:UDP-GlcNAc:undecaprenyl-phosphate/decaprenyl-phosphate GlcNAc-1-phosphate transferase
MWTYAETFGIACLASIGFTYLVREFARRRGLTAKPRADRWHQRPTALFGGVAIFLAFLAGHILGSWAHVSGLTLLLVCSSGMFVLGLVDDVARLKPQAKLVVQIAIATSFTMYGMRLHWFASPVLDQCLTVFWLVGITNALNLLDNIDGAAAGVSLVAGAFVVIFSHLTGNHAVALLASSFCGALLGFLVFNFNPASIFMGDCGSLFLGFFLAGVPMLNRQLGARRTVLSVLIVPILVLLIPILDTTLVTLTRKFHGRAVSQGGRDHTSHRLVALGLSERTAALTLWILSAISGVLALLVTTLSQAVLLLLLPMFAAALLFFFIMLGKVRVYEPVDSSAEGKGRALLPTLHDIAYKRRIFEVLSDSVIVVIAYYGGYLLRFEGAVVQPYYAQTIRSIPIVVAVQLGTFLLLGLYRGVWRYTSARDLLGIIRAVSVGWLASLAALAIVYRLEALSRAALLIDYLLLLLAISMTRVSFRWFQPLLARSRRSGDVGMKRALIYGAGDGGELLARELLNNPALGFIPVGFVDDDAQKHGRKIHGILVVGSLEGLPELVARVSAESVLVSTTKIPVVNRRRLQAACRASSIVPLELKISLREATD